MLFKKRFERARALQKEQRAAQGLEDFPEEGLEVEKGDVKALIISAFLVLMPAVIIIMIIFLLVLALFIWR
ncbi:MAG: hypothetical protein GX171_03740 [Clostridiales bacterium]|jgi:hypothetical protein|nr:hypothetical protein [Clostridiales bacterium]